MTKTTKATRIAAVLLILIALPAAIFANGNQEPAVNSQTWGPGYGFESRASGDWHGGGMGIHVLEVQQGSAAEESGILPGDVIIAVNGEYSYQAVAGGALSDLQAGDRVRINLMRFREEGSEYVMPEEKILDLELGSTADGRPDLGISYSIPGQMYGRGPAGHGMMEVSRGRAPAGRGGVRGFAPQTDQSF